MRLILAISLFFSLWLTQQHVVTHSDGHAHQSCSVCQTLSHLPFDIANILDFTAQDPVLISCIETVEHFQKINLVSFLPSARGPPFLS